MIDLTKEKIVEVARQTAVAYITNDVNVEYSDFFDENKVNTIKVKEQFKSLDLTTLLTVLTMAKMVAVKTTEEYLNKSKN